MRASTVSLRPTLGRASSSCLFLFKATATTYIQTLSLHDALPILDAYFLRALYFATNVNFRGGIVAHENYSQARTRSEEHTSELQSHSDLVCRLLLEKK